MSADKNITVADPGFPVGDAGLVGGANSRGGYVSKNLYVKTKESGPLGARAGGAPWIRQCLLFRKKKIHCLNNGSA